MAFNYLARMMGPDFALRRDFDPIRIFVRDGAIQPYRLITENQTPILADDEFLRRQTSGHLSVLQWDGETDDLASLFSPFNEITYRVVLCRGFSGVWRPIRHRHCYDLETLSALTLFGSSVRPAR